jgi:hypothetical protein
MIHTFEISLNGKPVTKARMNSGRGVTCASLSWVKRKGEKKGLTMMAVTGLNSATGRHVNWLKHTLVNIGDEITIHVTANKKADKPSLSKLSSKKLVLKSKIDYFHRLEKELEGHI